MFKSIRKQYMTGPTLVNGLFRILDGRGELSHFVASLHMRIDGEPHNVLAEFHPDQAEKLCEIIGLASLNQNVHGPKLNAFICVQVELVNVRKKLFSKSCTAKLVSAEFTPATERKLIEGGLYIPFPRLNA